jgi:hypothetical protein
MKSHYLHLRAFPCDICDGPVVTGSTAVCESDIQQETEITQVGAICLSCGRRQSEATAPERASDFPPVLWDPPKASRIGHTADLSSQSCRTTLSREL